MKKPTVFKSMRHVEAYINRDLSLDGVDDVKWPVEEEMSEKSDLANRYDFKGCKFECDIKHIGIEFKEIVDFRNSVFFCEADFCGSTFLKDIYFGGSVFSAEADFSGSMFSREVFFLGTSFYVKADFSFSTFIREADFSGSTFSKEVFFSDSIFSGAVYFSKSTFLGKADFSGCTFAKEVYFSETTFYVESYFLNTIFKDKVDWFKLESDRIDFYKATFLGLFQLDEAKIENLDLRSTTIKNNFTLNKLEVESADCETYRILKDQYLKQNNHIKALEFRKKEMNQHLREISWWRKPLETFMLLLNKASNNYGTSYGRGIVFLLVVSLAIFLLFINSADTSIYYLDDQHPIQSFLTYYMQFLNPTHRISSFEHLKLTGLSHVFDILGRVMISYALYQTVQAFRKYGKQ